MGIFCNGKKTMHAQHAWIWRCHAILHRKKHFHFHFWHIKLNLWLNFAKLNVDEVIWPLEPRSSCYIFRVKELHLWRNFLHRPTSRRSSLKCSFKTIVLNVLLLAGWHAAPMNMSFCVLWPNSVGISLGVSVSLWGHFRALKVPSTNNHSKWRHRVDVSRLVCKYRTKKNQNYTNNIKIYQNVT